MRLCKSPALLALVVATLLVIAPAGSAFAYTFETLHGFCAHDGCPSEPVGAPVLDSAGDIYGMTRGGGKYGMGVVFKLVPNGNDYKGYILHNFCARANCADGSSPSAGLIMDVDGNLYGTTPGGGKFGGGVVFKLTHGANGWSLGVIHDFCGQKTCAGGYQPKTELSYQGQASGAPWDTFAPLFGTTDYGGTNGRGTAFELLTDGSLWNYEIVHNFNTLAGPTANPGPILVDPSGNLIGETHTGGKNNSGVLYRLAASTWKETTLHNFCNPPDCADGATGVGRPVMDASGNLYGTTLYSYCNEDGCNGGVAFKRTTGGAYQVIYRFCASIECSDGTNALGLAIDAAGALYGTTSDGGTHQMGTVFRLDYNSTQQQWAYTMLHTFCSNACKDGDMPAAPPVVDAAGNIYGYTPEAPGSNGTVFELSP